MSYGSSIGNSIKSKNAMGVYANTEGRMYKFITNGDTTASNFKFAFANGVNDTIGFEKVNITGVYDSTKNETVYTFPNASPSASYLYIHLTTSGDSSSTATYTTNIYNTATTNKGLYYISPVWATGSIYKPDSAIWTAVSGSNQANKEFNSQNQYAATENNTYIALRTGFHPGDKVKVKISSGTCEPFVDTLVDGTYYFAAITSFGWPPQDLIAPVDVVKISNTEYEFTMPPLGYSVVYGKLNGATTTYLNRLTVSKQTGVNWS